MNQMKFSFNASNKALNIGGVSLVVILLLYYTFGLAALCLYFLGMLSVIILEGWFLLEFLSRDPTIVNVPVQVGQENTVRKEQASQPNWNNSTESQITIPPNSLKTNISKANLSCSDLPQNQQAVLCACMIERVETPSQIQKRYKSIKMLYAIKSNFFDGQLKTLSLSGKTLKQVGDASNTLLGKKQELSLFFFNGNQDKATCLMKTIVHQIGQNFIDRATIHQKEILPGIQANQAKLKVKVTESKGLYENSIKELKDAQQRHIKLTVSQNELNCKLRDLNKDYQNRKLLAYEQVLQLEVKIKLVERELLDLSPQMQDAKCTIDEKLSLFQECNLQVNSEMNLLELLYFDFKCIIQHHLWIILRLNELADFNIFTPFVSGRCP